MARFISVVTGLAAIAILILLALYIARPGQTESPSVAGPTPYPSIVLYPTLTPSPAPDRDARIITLADGSATTVPIPSAFTISAILSGGRALLRDGQQTIELMTVTSGAVRVLSTQMTSDIQVSNDARYAAWLEGDHAVVFDAEDDQTSSAIPPAEFESSLSDGGMVFTTNSGSIAIVDHGGTVTDRLPTYYYASGFSPDARQFAWPSGAGLQVYDRSSRATRVLPDVQSVAGRVAWSEDASRIAYLRLVGDNSVRIWIVDAVTGSQYEVFAAQRGEHIERLSLSRGELSFHLIPAADTRWGDTFGVRYTANSDGTNLRAIDDPARPWGLCGPVCGMPPDGYEDTDGLARWCELTAGDQCVLHLVYVDRSRNEVKEIIASNDYVATAVSPDRTRLALLRSDGDNQVLRLVSLVDFSYRRSILDSRTLTTSPGRQMVHACCCISVGAIELAVSMLAHRYSSA